MGDILQPEQAVAAGCLAVPCRPSRGRGVEQLGEAGGGQRRGLVQRSAARVGGERESYLVEAAVMQRPIAGRVDQRVLVGGGVDLGRHHGGEVSGRLVQRAKDLGKAAHPVRRVHGSRRPRRATEQRPDGGGDRPTGLQRRMGVEEAEVGVEGPNAGGADGGARRDAVHDGERTSRQGVRQRIEHFRPAAATAGGELVQAHGQRSPADVARQRVTDRDRVLAEERRAVRSLLVPERSALCLPHIGRAAVDGLAPGGDVGGLPCRGSTLAGSGRQPEPGASRHGHDVSHRQRAPVEHDLLHGTACHGTSVIAGRRPLVRSR